MVVLVAEDDDAIETFLLRDGQQQFQGCRRVAIALFPWHDRVAHMARDLGRQLLCTRVKTQADAAAEFTVPDPEQTGGQRRRSGPGVWLAVGNEFAEILRSVLAQAREFAAHIGCVAGAARIGRPAGGERRFEVRKVLQIRREQDDLAAELSGICRRH